jgi:C4-dicarboxylate transporter, DctM subunit
MDPGLILIFAFLILLLLGLPIAVALGSVAIFAIWYANLGIPVVSSNVYAGIAKFPLLAIPFFILAGIILERCGVSKRLVHLTSLVVGSVPGGLAIVAILVCVFFGGISGSGPADAAAIGAVLIPAMARKNYRKDFAAALIAAAGSTAIVIPPSIAFILYGVIMGVSVPALFAGGILPGVLAGLSLIIPAYVISKKHGYAGERRGSWKEIFLAFKDALWGLLAPLVILGGIYGGIFTATESAVVAIFYGLLVGFVIYRTLNWRVLYDILVDSALSSAVVLLIVALAGLYGWAAATLGVVDRSAKLILSISTNEWVVLALVNVMLLIAGMLLDAISIYYICLPILIPIMAHFHWDPLWFGVVMTLNLAIGQFTPPVAVNLYVTTNLAQVSFEKVSLATIPFILTMAGSLVLVVLFPWLSLYLPQLWGLYAR